MHPDISHLADLLGVWRGRGKGHYPTIEPFAYLEEVSFGHVGKPFIAYTQKTRHAETELPLHAEAGYFRPVGQDRIELVLAQPSGIAEIDEGSVRRDEETGSLHIDVTSTTVSTSGSAKEVTAVQRTLTVVGDELTYDVFMAAVGQEFQHHLRATLRRVEL